MENLGNRKLLTNLHIFLMSEFGRLPEHATQYLLSRGLSYDYLRRAGCGYLTQHGGEILKGYEGTEHWDTMKKIGFITPSGHFLTDSIYFPLYDHMGNIDSFSIRILPESDFIKKGGSPHWTMKLPIGFPIGCCYPKSGLDPYKGRATFICEGATDTVTLLQNGYNAIGLVGISNWRDQYIDFLHTTAVVIAFDRDVNKAGQKASAKLARRLANAGMSNSVYFLELPMGEDINSFYSEDFFAYSKKHTHRFLETSTGKRWLEEKARKAVNPQKSNNQMSQKITDAKGKRILDVYRRLFGNVSLYEFERGYKTRCPFHEDGRASMHIYTDTNSFFCFGCQASGDTIDLVRKVMPNRDFNREIIPFMLEI